jgi:predicted ABC-type sugar transport system permease subunit
MHMTFQDAIAQQPQWLTYWLYWLTFGTLVLPVVLLFWRQSRVAGAAGIAATVTAVFSVSWLFDRLGYVKLLGLPHIILWTPFVIYLFFQIRRTDMPKWPRWIMTIVLATILVSLAFDYTDVARYLLGERAAFVKPT